MNLCICIIAPHLGTLDIQRVGVKHAVLEPNHKTVFGGHLQKMEGSAKATEDPSQWSEGPKAENNISTNLVLPSGKSWCMSYYFKL